MLLSGSRESNLLANQRSLESQTPEKFSTSIPTDTHLSWMGRTYLWRPILFQLSTPGLQPLFRTSIYPIRLIAREDIKKYLSIANDDVQILSIYWDEVIQQNVKELRYPERPPRAIISVSVRNEPGEGWRDWNIGERTTSLILETRVIGEFKTASVRRLSIVPFFTVACKSSARSSVRICQSKFMTEDEEIESRPRVG